MGALYSFWLPETSGPAGAYALVGMAAVFAACAHAPLTAILIVFEMSNDYALILPLMVAAVTASNVAQYLFKESMYTTKLTRRGIRFSEGRDLDIMQGVLVREVMNEAPVTVKKDAPLSVLYQRFQETNYLGFPVVDNDGMLHGIVTLQDLERVLDNGDTPLRELKVEDVAVTEPVTAFPDEPIWTAIQKMAPRDLARLPVVSRSNDKVLIGLISRSNILRAYDVGIVRKQRGQMLSDTSSLRQEKKNVFIELRIQPGYKAAGVCLQDMELVDSINVVSIERNGELRIPNGKSRFASGDIVTIFTKKELVDIARQQFEKGLS
jgi:CIC family chloride channel protein